MALVIPKKKNGFEFITEVATHVYRMWGSRLTRPLLIGQFDGPLFVTQYTFWDRIGRKLGNFHIKSYKRKIINLSYFRKRHPSSRTYCPSKFCSRDCNARHFQRDKGSLTNFARICTCMNALINTNRQTIFAKEFSSNVPE